MSPRLVRSPATQVGDESSATTTRRARPPRAWVPLEFRECRACAIWTECALCPGCLARLEPAAPPYASPVVRGELDIAPLTLDQAVRGACLACGLYAPFHASTSCPGIAFVAAPPPAGPWLVPIPAPASPAP